MSGGARLVATINAALVAQGLAPSARVAADGTIVSAQSSRKATRDCDRIRRRTRIRSGGLRVIITDIIAIADDVGLTITQIAKAADRSSTHVNKALARLLLDGEIVRTKEATPAGKKFRWRYFLKRV